MNNTSIHCESMILKDSQKLHFQLYIYVLCLGSSCEHKSAGIVRAS